MAVGRWLEEARRTHGAMNHVALKMDRMEEEQFWIDYGIPSSSPLAAIWLDFAFDVARRLITRRCRLKSDVLGTKFLSSKLLMLEGKARVFAQKDI